MINISQNIIANVDVSMAAVLLILGVLVMTLRRKTTGSKADTAYLLLIITVLAATLSDLYLAFFDNPEDPGPYVLLVIMETILEISVNLILLAWLLYVFFTMYDSMDYLRRKFLLYIVPILVMVVFDIINVFTGWIWYFDENMVYHETDLYMVLNLIRYAYLFISIYQYQRYKKENGHIQFFTIWPFIVPIAWGSLLEVFTPVYGFSFGAAIGITMLFIMSSQKVSFTDEESGFYNIHYLNMLRDKIRAGENESEPHLVIHYRLATGNDNDMKEFFSQLKEILPDFCDTVKIDDTHYITIIYGNTRGLINLLSEDIEMIADSLKLELKYDYAIKEKQETAADFFEKNAVIGG